MSDAARVRRAALVLLLLTFHALQAGATHFPRTSRTLPSQSDHDSSASARCEAFGTAETGGHTQCLLCRLQRGLSLGLRNSAPVAFPPPHDALLIEADSPDDHQATHSRSARGRAPPHS